MNSVHALKTLTDCISEYSALEMEALKANNSRGKVLSGGGWVSGIPVFLVKMPTHITVANPVTLNDA